MTSRLGKADEEYVQVLVADPENQTFDAIFTKDHALEGFRRVCAQARRNLCLQRLPRSRRLPHLLPESSLMKFYDAIEHGGDRMAQSYALRIGLESEPESRTI